jgi:hypothetical protein
MKKILIILLLLTIIYTLKYKNLNIDQKPALGVKDDKNKPMYGILF